LIDHLFPPFSIYDWQLKMDMVTGRAIVLVNNRLGFVQIPGRLNPTDLDICTDFHLCIVCYPNEKASPQHSDHVFVRYLSFY
jgi:hypothetical protein